jgi:hypothetical protein
LNIVPNNIFVYSKVTIELLGPIPPLLGLAVSQEGKLLILKLKPYHQYSPCE